MRSEEPKSTAPLPIRGRASAGGTRRIKPGEQPGGKKEEMEKERVLELATRARAFWEARDLLTTSVAANDFVTAIQQTLSDEAEKGGYLDPFEEAMGWRRDSTRGAIDELAVDWEKARKIAEALEVESGTSSGPWPKLHIEGTLCYAHETLFGENLELFAEYWDEISDMPKWDQLEDDQKIVAVLRSARSHFSADISLTADDFTRRMNPLNVDCPRRLLDPIPASSLTDSRAQ